MIIPGFDEIVQLCKNSAAPVLPSTSKNGIVGVWSPAVISTVAVGAMNYTFAPNPGQNASGTILSVVVTEPVVPTFDAIPSLCKNSVAPVLPTTSKNGIVGTWSPSVISTVSVGTTNYTFTPNAGQCAAPIVKSIEIVDFQTPIFSLVSSLYQSSAAPVLPGTSNNGIVGTWVPSTISTSTVGTTNYTFTPNAGQCAVPVVKTIEITNLIIPIFDEIAPLCKNSAAPSLPTTSKNGIVGVWSPAVISTIAVGMMSNTFTPITGQNASGTILSVVVTEPVVPTFDAIAPICKNSAAPVLPAISKNGIAGVWSPSVISTAIVGTTDYTFTPNPGQCAVSVVKPIVITNLIIPVFDEIATLCKNSIAPVLPTTSKNGIAGVWSPSVISTSTVGTTDYTFTPNAGQCATTAVLSVQVTDLTVPTFDAIAPICKNSAAPVLPAISKNGIAGIWSPSVISTATVGTANYTFTPNAGQCATTAVLSVQVTDLIVPTFDVVASLCKNSAAPVLPTTSKNGIAGVWWPSVISTTNVGTTNYTFTPNSGQCSGITVLPIEVLPLPKNLPPVARDDRFVASCSGVKGQLVLNDFDPENDPFFISLVPVLLPLHGSLVLSNDGSFDYRITSGYIGSDWFRYAIFDLSHSSGDTATVIIDIVADSDCDGIPNDLDADADGDGIMLAEEGGFTIDSDGDGVPNYLDIDSDNDGISDELESQSHRNYIAPLAKDSDRDGLDDAYDPDSGGVRIVPIDTDGDKIPDFIDSDSDSDGVADYIEAHDLNADGKPDLALLGRDLDGDGMDDGFERMNKSAQIHSALNTIYSIFPDFDNDNDPDWRDANDDNDDFPTKYEDMNGDGNFSNDDIDHDGKPEYLDPGRDCNLFIPDAFSPNGDNIHDYFQILCIHSYPNARLYVFDQQGTRLFEKDHYGNLDFWKTNEQAWWNGSTSNKSSKNNGDLVLPGTYFYILNLGNGDVRKSYVFVSY